MMRLDVQLLGAGVTVLMSAGSLAAQSAGCSQINNTTFANPSMVGTTLHLSTSPLDAGEVVRITASNLTTVGSYHTSFEFRDGSTTLSPVFYDAPGPAGAIDLSFTIPNSGASALAIYDTNFTGPLSFDNFLASCPVGGVINTFVIGEVAGISSAAHQSALSGAVENAATTRLRGNDVATRNGIFYFSTADNDAPGAMESSAWVSLDTSTYFDAYEGYSANVVAGFDTIIRPGTLIGVTLSAGLSDVEDKLGNNAEATSLSFGVYAAQEMSTTGLIFNGYLNYASVDYKTDTSEFNTDRILAGLGLSGEQQFQMGTLTPRARIWAAWEDFPAGTAAVTGGTTRQLFASVGARMDWSTSLPSTNLHPFLSIDVEYGSVDEVGGTSDNFLAPRLGLGLTGQVTGGDLVLALDVGQTRSDVTEVSLEVSFSKRF